MLICCNGKQYSVFVPVRYSNLKLTLILKSFDIVTSKTINKIKIVQIQKRSSPPLKRRDTLDPSADRDLKEEGETSWSEGSRVGWEGEDGEGGKLGEGGVGRNGVSDRASSRCDTYCR